MYIPLIYCICMYTYVHINIYIYMQRLYLRYVGVTIFVSSDKKRYHVYIKNVTFIFMYFLSYVFLLTLLRFFFNEDINDGRVVNIVCIKEQIICI